MYQVDIATAIMRKSHTIHMYIRMFICMYVRTYVLADKNLSSTLIFIGYKAYNFVTWMKTGQVTWVIQVTFCENQSHQTLIKTAEGGLKQPFTFKQQCCAFSM